MSSSAPPGPPALTWYINPDDGGQTEIAARCTAAANGRCIVEMIGDGVAFAGVAKFPARVKCALLGWKAFQAATSDALGEKE